MRNDHSKSLIRLRIDLGLLQSVVNINHQFDLYLIPLQHNYEFYFYLIKPTHRLSTYD